MSFAGKVFAVISLVAAVFYAGITAALMSLQENYKQKLADEQAIHAQDKKKAEIEKADLEGKNKQLDGELVRANKENNRLDGEVRYLRDEWAAAAGINRFAMQVIDDQEDQIALLNTRNDRYNADLIASRADSDKKQARIDELSKGLTDMTASRDALSDALKTTQVLLTNNSKEVEKLTSDLTTANDMLQRYKERDPEGYTQLLRPDTTIRPPKVIRGKVTGVDKGLGLVILNIGQRNEVAKGYSFIVFRGDEYIGKVVVDEVFPDMSATHYDKPAMKKDVEVGDDVTTRLSIDL